MIELIQVEKKKHAVAVRIVLATANIKHTEEEGNKCTTFQVAPEDKQNALVALKKYHATRRMVP